MSNLYSPIPVIIVLAILVYIAIHYRMLYKESELRYATLKKQVTNEKKSEQKEAQLAFESLQNYLLILLGANPVGIISTTRGQMIRRTFEIKKAGKVDCRRRTKDKEGTRRVIVPVELAYEDVDDGKVITRKKLLWALSKDTPEQILKDIKENLISIEDSVE